MEMPMSSEQVEVLIFGSVQGGMLLAWHMAQSGRRTTVIEKSESEAQALGMAVRVARLPMSAVLRTEATDEKQGFIKALVVGSKADDVMAVVQTAMPRSAVFKHPTAIGCHLNRTMSRR
jgi:pyruvate/2-oxoglutarate dehydrogenase complex dihydrolipoamide dehydrogenase (E3) component